MCAFYSPPRSKMREKLKDHITGTLQMLTTKYPGCGILVGGDKNKMNISSLLNSNLKLQQIVTSPTRKQEILDVLLTNLFPYYHTPIIIPPVQPDVPGQGVPSDHSVPLCIPNRDPDNPPTRQYRTVVSRPLPESKVREFGQWMTSETWDIIRDDEEPNQQVSAFQALIGQKLDTYLPKKIVKLGINEKPFITSELKTLKRKRMREYKANGKSEKYLRLKREFDMKYKRAAGDFMKKNIESLKETNPGQAYNILKRMGAMPGESDCVSNFTLSSHENLTPKEAANKIADHFSKISREYPPLSLDTLPERVKKKLISPESESTIPEIRDYEVFNKIKSASKPKVGVPGDLPRRLVSEFSPELAQPMCTIFNTVFQSAKQGAAKWPTSWKLEHGIPLQKVQHPITEDDLRVISLTPFFSKCMERFVVDWLMSFIGHKLDPKQFGGLKGNSISHYMIELINFIRFNQDYNLPVAILACTIDFSKAFNRQNHNILITTLSDMGVPGWLLNIIMGFLKDREMVVSYKGETTEAKQLPGGGPQGTLLGLLLFLVLINLCGFDEQVYKIGENITQAKPKFSQPTLHTKYVDDLLIAEAVNMQECLIENPDRPLPDPFHSRHGMKLDPEKSKVYKEIQNVNSYATINQMKINQSKSKFIVFNPTTSYDFVPEFKLEETPLETVENMKLLGLIISNDLTWKENTENLTKRAYGRLWSIRRLVNHGATLEDLIEVYIKQVRSILEYGVPVWNSSITKQESLEFERVQKTFHHIALGNQYSNYENALVLTGLETLESRRLKLCINFSKKASKHPKHKHWFAPTNPKLPNTQSLKVKFKKPLCRLKRFESSPIPYLTSLLNNQ